MKSMPLIEGWNRCSSFGVACGVFMGFLAGVFAISVPYSHSIDFFQYRTALGFAMIFFCIGLLVTDFFFGRFKNQNAVELKEPFFLSLVRTRVYSSFVRAFLLMYAVTFFTWFMLRTQFQWTTTVLCIAQAVVYFLFCLFAYLSVKEENTECVRRYHALPTLSLD